MCRYLAALIVIVPVYSYSSVKVGDRAEFACTIEGRNFGMTTEVEVVDDDKDSIQFRQVNSPGNGFFQFYTSIKEIDNRDKQVEELVSSCDPAKVRTVQILNLKTSQIEQLGGCERSYKKTYYTEGGFVYAAVTEIAVSGMPLASPVYSSTVYTYENPQLNAGTDTCTMTAYRRGE